MIPGYNIELTVGDDQQLVSRKSTTNMSLVLVVVVFQKFCHEMK